MEKLFEKLLVKWNLIFNNLDFFEAFNSVEVEENSISFSSKTGISFKIDYLIYNSQYREYHEVEAKLAKSNLVQCENEVSYIKEINYCIENFGALIIGLEDSNLKMGFYPTGRSEPFIATSGVIDGIKETSSLEEVFEKLSKKYPICIELKAHFLKFIEELEQKKIDLNIAEDKEYWNRLEKF